MTKAEAPAAASGRMAIHVVLERGPDAGRARQFRADRVAIGRHPDNDLVIADPSLEPMHGVLERTNGGLRWHASGSPNASIVEVDGHPVLVGGDSGIDSIRLSVPTAVGIGDSLLVLSLRPSSARRGRRLGKTSDNGNGDRTRARLRPSSEPNEGRRPLQTFDRIVQAIPVTPERVSTRLEQTSERLRVLFALTSQLNALNRFDDILEKVADATFDMFPAATLFEIVVPDGDGERPDLRPLFRRRRAGAGEHDLTLSKTIVRQVVEQRESVLYVRDASNASVSESLDLAEVTSCLAAPLVAQRSLMGVMQVDTRGITGVFNNRDLDLFVILASSVAFAMERARLSRSIYDMFEAFVEASVSAIEARDPTTAGHSQRVAYYTLLTAEGVNRIISGPLGPISFTPDELTELRYAALLHDFGKIGVAEQVLQKPTRLMPEVHALVLQRLSTYEQLLRRQAHEQLLRRLAEEQRPPSPEDIAALDVEIGLRTQKARLFRDLVDRRQLPTKGMSEADRQLLEELRATTFVDGLGQTVELISEEEASDLQIARGTLNKGERAHIESHAALTQDYLSRIPWSDDLKQVPCIAGRHHEKLDGSGYPRRLDAVQLLPQIRILTIADIFDALTAADRPYRKAASPDMAASILRLEAKQGKLDGELVEFFIGQVIPTVGRRLPCKSR